MANSSISFRRRAALLGLAAFLGAAAVVSCESLENVDKNECGNRVLETGEDCDGNLVPGEEAVNGLTTVPPNLCGATCRYVCNLADDPTVVCPADFGCGIDGTCRKPGGLSTPPLSIGGGGVRRFLSGDFDGDGRQDAVALGDNSLDILFFGTNGLIDRSLTVPNERRLPGVGDIDGDGTSDLVLNLGDALGVLSGQDNRTLKPWSYHSGELESGGTRLVPLGRIGTENTLLAFITKEGQTHLETITVNGNAEPVHKKVGGMQELVLSGTLVGAVAVSENTKSGSKCPVVAFELASTPSQVVLLSCGESGQLAEEPKHTVIPLPLGGAAWAGAFFADADDDGDDDLLVGAAERLHFFANDDTGKFMEAVNPGDDSPLLPLVVEPGQCGGRVLAGPPLAVGHLDGNRALDVVDARGVLYNPYYKKEAIKKSCISPSSVSWAHAIIGDFNGNGLPDVLASRSAQTLLDVWSSVPGGELNTFTVPVEELVGELALGDFDGDSVDDAVLRYAPPPSPGNEMMTPASELIVLFGRPLAAPEAPFSLGFYRSLEHIATGRVKGTNAIGAPDLLDDLVVLSAAAGDSGGAQGMPKPFTIIEGNVGRRLLAPLTIKGTSDGAPPGTMPVTASAPTQIIVSRFGVEACNMQGGPGESAQGTRATIAAATDSAVWLAGCRQDGSSLRVLEELDTGKGNILLAPVNYSQNRDALGVFLKAETGGRGLWVADYDPKTGFEASPKLGDISSVLEDLVLPNPDPFDAPAVVVDVDGNGRRDVVLLANTVGPMKDARPRSAVAVYWNDGTGTETLDGKRPPTVITIPQELLEDPDTSTDGNTSSDDLIQGIADIAFLNIDGDAARELVVLTQRGLYVLDLGKDQDGKRVFKLPEDDNPFARLPGGQALLAIDANSDGVDDLLVAEGPRLLLFLGKEAAR
ncbi:VCBS repeat-containing protein [Polyangium sp. 15x6]|uniref:FG-GAP repeat domain-containing protein n=1 Tax=Polyangium sp. 15x6 TaxID=3042687 RepID=UPI00249A43D6|nr:VCBS repeat-containing protein [Polyangium sp. 15x6]MDI3286779.1 VCBS repeat-containing protein [Polyangium sp. 15x6]